MSDNKKVTQMVEVTTVNSDDLFYMVTTSPTDYGSKRIKAENIKNYVLNGGVLGGTIDSSSYAKTASYVNPANIGLIPSASYSISSSRSEISYISLYSITASYISSSNIDGPVPTSLYSNTASYVNYMYNNGCVENSKTASYCRNAITASYLYYVPGVDNGVVSVAISAANAAFDGTASYLKYTGIPNGTASLALNILNNEITASYLLLKSGRVNGTASNSISSSYSLTSSFSNAAGYLYYNGVSNGTASYALNSNLAKTALQSINSTNATYATIAINATSASYCDLALSASYSNTSSWCSQTASYALIAEHVNDTSLSKLYGPYSADSQTTTKAYIQNFVINNYTGLGKPVMVEAIGDIKVPITQTELASYVYLYLENTDPSDTWKIELDKSNITNYVNLSTSGAFSLSGYNKQGFTLAGSHNLSGSWYRFSIETDGGVTLDTRSVKFILNSNADSITKTSYPPY